MPTASRPFASDGILDLPRGKIAAVATYLEMTRKPEGTSPSPLPGVTLQSLRGQLPRYRTLYTRIGQPWLWFSRTVMPDLEVAAILNHPGVDALALHVGREDVGMLELDFRTPGTCELAFLGLVPGVMGRGLGRFLVREGIRLAFARGTKRLWLHTCTLDHPKALALYLAAGFRPYRRAIEVADDPRLTGAMPREAGNGLPIL